VLEQADGFHEREVGVQFGGIEPRGVIRAGAGLWIAHPITVPVSNSKHVTSITREKHCFEVEAR
jgi:hypothetical protein